jgi:hypothetical protein
MTRNAARTRKRPSFDPAFDLHESANPTAGIDGLISSSGSQRAGSPKSLMISGSERLGDIRLNACCKQMAEACRACATEEFYRDC